MSAAVLDQPTLLDALDDRRDMKEVNGARGHAEDVPDLTSWLWEHEGQWVTITSLGRCADECLAGEEELHAHSGWLVGDPHVIVISPDCRLERFSWGIKASGEPLWVAETFGSTSSRVGMTATNHEVLSISA